MNSNACDKINNIERTYPVENIEYKGIKIWPFIRTHLYSYYLYQGTNNDPGIKTAKMSFLSKVHSVLQAIKLTSFVVLLRKNSAVLFTTNTLGAVRVIDGVYVDSFLGEIIKQEESIIPIILRKGSPRITAFNKFIDRAIFILIIKMALFHKAGPIKKWGNLTHSQIT
ncbi:hypothetical protein AGMMS49944_26850 [Spirochaetia bacterium]|nr:hypothetical protein AGMMS49944_26850 [Spirochaetia bacterium]